jgi:hypothetical protein
MRYFFRAVKYLVKIVVLLALIFFVMQRTGTTNIESVGNGGFMGFWESFFAAARGQVFAVALLVWCAVYPAVEFRRRHLFYDMHDRKSAIVKAMHAGGMTLVGDGGDSGMVFVGSLGRRIWWMGDDKVTITPNPSGGLDIEGPRRFVMEAEHRIPSYVGAEKENE